MLEQDLRYALRSLARSPGFFGAAVVTLALGIGASTAIFSVIENVLMQPFPYVDSHRLFSMQIHDNDQKEPGGRGAFQGPEYTAYAEQNRVFDGVVALSVVDVLYAAAEGTERLQGIYVPPGTFEFFGMPALLGRPMGPSDYEPGAPPVFVLRHKVWVSRFNADSRILNQTFVLNGQPRTLVGIMPPRFAWGNGDVWLPMKPARALDPSSGERPKYWFLVGRLKRGLSVRQAEAELDVLAHNVAKLHPKDYPKRFTLQLQSLAEGVVGQFRSTLYVVMAAVALLLLIGCANVANLLLARAAVREKELAVRAALGAGRYRLVRQLLVESLLLALSSAVLGCGLAWAGLKALVAFIPPRIIPAEAVIGLNGRVLLFSLAVAVSTALLFGLVPALQAVGRAALSEPLRDSGKGSSGGSRRGRVRDAIVVAEVALSLTLLVGAGLLIRSFMALREVDLGLEPRNVLVARLPLPRERYQTAAQLASFYRPLLARVKALPGVVAATETSTLPPYGGIRSPLEIPGLANDEKWTTLVQLCSEDYFTVLRIRFLQGRPFTEAEVDAQRRLAVVNQMFVHRYLGQRNPLGQTIRLKELQNFPDKVEDPSFEIVGVVADAKNQGLQDPPLAEAWVPYTVTGSGERGVLVRTAGEPLAMLKAVRKEIQATDSNVALTLTGSLEGFISEFSFAGPRFGFVLMSVFAGVGLVLVTLGVYSVLTYAIAHRTREIGIRIAVGAGNADVLRLVMVGGAQLVTLGVALGLACSLALGRAITSQLWGVSPNDPATVLAVVLVLFATGLVACWVPARRATRVDPVVALRYE